MKIRLNFRKTISFLLAVTMMTMLFYGLNFGTITAQAINYSIGEGDSFSLDVQSNVKATFTITEALGTGSMRGWLICLFKEKPSVDASTSKLIGSGDIHPYSHSNCAYYFFSADSEKKTGTCTAVWSGTAKDEKEQNEANKKTLAEVIKEEDWYIVIGPRYYYTGWGASGIGAGNNGIWENCDYYIGLASTEIKGYDNPFGILTQPQNVSVEEGETATFTAEATGDDLSYQWQVDKNDGNGFVNIDGATSESYTISAVDLDSNGFKYKCIVTSEGESETSDEAILTVTKHYEPIVYNGEIYYPIGNNQSLTEGNYYLPEDVTLDGPMTVSGTVNLCLNGNVLNADSITVSDGATLNIDDSGSKEHKYKTSDNGCWTPDESGDKVIVGGVICSPIINEGTFNLNDGTICGVNGVAINNKGIATIGKNSAVMGNYNGTAEYDNNDIPTSIPAVVYNGKDATFYNSGKINNNVAKVHTVCNDGGVFTNMVTGTINDNTVTSTTDATAAGGVANYTRNTSYISEFFNYGQINNNKSARSTGGVLNKGGEFTNYETGQINGNTAARHCGGVDNTSNAYIGVYGGTFFKNYGQVNDNEVFASNDGGSGAGIYNEGIATIYNYGEVCGNTAVYQGGGIYFNDGSGTLIVGEMSKVTDNKDSSGNDSNICVGSGKVIEFDSENPLVDGATMGVYLYNGERIDGEVSFAYTEEYGATDVNKYFFADTPTQDIVLKNQEVYLQTHVHKLELVPDTVATCAKPGNIAYYKCVVGKCTCLFEDKNGNTSTTEEAVKIAPLGHDWSGKWTVTKEATSTQEGKKVTYCENGCGQKKVATIPVVGAIESDCNLEKDVEVAPGAPIKDMALNNTNEEILEVGKIFTETEKQRIKNGESARVWLEINQIIDVDPGDKRKIEEAANTIGENLNITYFDAKMFKKIGTTDALPVYEPGIKIKLTIAIPTELINKDSKINREYKILRLHEGETKAEIISGTFDPATGEFSFETDKFSTYAIVYKDAPAEDAGNKGNDGNDGNDVVKPNDELKDQTAKPGDATNALSLFGMMLICGVGIHFCLRRNEDIKENI